MVRSVAPRVLAWPLALALILTLAGSWPRPSEDARDVARRPSIDPLAAASVSFTDAMASAPSIVDRKRRFVAYVLPLVDAVNAEILVQRRGVERLRAKRAAHDPLTRSELRWLDGVKATYGATSDDLALLLARVDAVPPSLALAQAALESGWGTSRFVRDGNALFGQRTWDAGSGLVPIDQTVDATFAVRSFADLQASVAAYMLNLNSHPAYDGFRRARDVLRNHGELNGFVLAGSMAAYSEIGHDYITQVRSIIRGNRLGTHDRALIDG